MQEVQLEDNMGNFIAARRREKGFTQKQLADQLGVTDKAVSKWERSMGYPDITLLVRLAECLEITPGELLRGVREEAPAPDEEPQALMEYTYEYAGRVSEGRFTKRRRLASAIFSASCFLAVVICMICDLSINGRFTWVVYPAASVIYGWLLCMPALTLQKQPLFTSLLSASVFTLPFLLVLAQASGGGWFYPVAVPCTLMSLAWLWLVYLTAACSRSPWYASAVGLLLTPVLNLTVDVAISLYSGVFQLSGWDFVTTVLCVVSSAVLFAVGRLRRGGRQAAQPV